MRILSSGGNGTTSDAFGPKDHHHYRRRIRYRPSERATCWKEGARVIGVDLNGDDMPDGVEAVIGDVTAAATIARAVETAGTIMDLARSPASAAPVSPSMSSRPKTGTRFLR